MGFFQLDEKAQLALLLAGLAGASGLAGCDDGRPTPTDARVDQPIVVDPLPHDFRAETVVVDPPPRDFRVDQPMVVDMVPPDMQVDFPPVSDPLPVDASAANPALPGQPPVPQPRGHGQGLPINRDLRVQIKAQRLEGGKLELRTVGNSASCQHRWIASAGSLDRSDGATVIWTPPAEKGLHMVQVTARDGSRAISVDVLLHEIY